MQLERKAHRAAPRITDLLSLVSGPIMTERTLALTGGQARLSLETMVWEGLDEAARRQGRPVAELCGELDATKPSEVELATAIRTFVLGYYRQANGN
ncbi:MAG TPA: ribbon-helix-helix domain-containing protein [Azospirillum sp.]|nr:ribbon-helix-helix domain-containing protein [Azospirillum sp.]